MLEESGICKNDDSFVFYGQPSSKEGSVKHFGSTNGQNEIHLSLNEIPDTIHKVALTLTIHEGEGKGGSFSAVSSANLLLKDRLSGEILYSFTFGEELQQETAIVVGEFYRHNGEWKLNPVGSGFDGGLPSLCGNYGLDIINEPTAPVPVEKKVEEVKPLIVTLKKKETISIKKTAKVVATLEWKSKKDLDLYCFYVTKDGQEGKVYYKNLGSSSMPPFITLDGDSKNSGKETVTVHNPSQLSYVLFAAYSAISNGFGSFKAMRAMAVVDNQIGQKITTPLFENNKFSYWVAIAKIDFTDINGMKVSHVEAYSKFGTERSPLLYKDGTFKMNVGPVEFK
ncbi:TerD family protein [Sporosarcina psychrophila]|uniref:Stress response protein SCP2 n=1 Tax=Sporosarcina psychrophila TaxID=1476 RepID=A0ABV2K4K6_SPOPS